MTEQRRASLIQSGKDISFVVMLIGFIAYAVRQADLTFDSQEQKYETVEAAHKDPVITEAEVEATRSHIDNTAVHMTLEEKEELVEMKTNQKHMMNNQVKIGQDLDEIKNLIRNNHD